MRISKWFLPVGAIICTLAAAQPSDAPVGFTPVVTHRIQPILTLPGTVESRSASVVASEIEAVVVEIEVEEGDRVAAGAALAHLRRITVDLRLKEERGRLTEARARLDLAESKLERAKRLFDDEVISQDELDDAHSERTAWQGRVDQTEAVIDQLDVALTRTVVRAPFAGVVVAKRTEVGEWMPVGGPVVEMLSLDRLEVRVQVPERFYSRLDRGIEADVTFEALPDSQVTGTIVGVVRQADPQSRTFPIRVRIANPGWRIGAGMLARVSLPVGGESVDALLVPKDAVVRQGPREVVYRINDDRTVEPVEVESGQGVGPWVVVAGEVSEGQRVVTRGNERLRPGQTVAGSLQEYPRP